MRMYRTANRTYEGATEADLAEPSVIEFLAVHDMFKRELARLVEFVEQIVAAVDEMPPNEIARYVAILAEAFYNYTNYLHAHHGGETDAIFPALTPLGLPEEVTERLNREHDELAAQLDRMDRAFDAPDAKLDGDSLRDLTRLADLLRAHLDYEETHVCPLLPKLRGWPPGIQEAWQRSHSRQRPR